MRAFLPSFGLLDDIHVEYWIRNSTLKFYHNFLQFCVACNIERGERYVIEHTHKKMLTFLETRKKRSVGSYILVCDIPCITLCLTWSINLNISKVGPSVKRNCQQPNNNTDVTLCKEKYFRVYFIKHNIVLKGSKWVTCLMEYHLVRRCTRYGSYCCLSIFTEDKD